MSPRRELKGRRGVELGSRSMTRRKLATHSRQEVAMIARDEAFDVHVASTRHGRYEERSRLAHAFSIWKPTRSIEFLSYSGMLRMKRLAAARERWPRPCSRALTLRGLRARHRATLADKKSDLNLWSGADKLGAPLSFRSSRWPGFDVFVFSSCPSATPGLALSP